STMLQLCGVSKTYGKLQVLAPTDLELEPGKITALIGPSGCGKSTLLRIMVGLIEPDRGEVIFDGERLTRGNARRLRHRMGYVIQDGGLFPHLTCAQNATLLARHLKWSRQQCDERLQELA